MILPHRIAAIASALVLAFFPVQANAGSDGPIAISANDQMKFDVTAITAKVGQTLTISLTNAGSLMAHNLVILKPGTDVTAFVIAASKRAGDGYLPNDEQASHMVVYTKMLDGGDSDKITFTPAAPGVYEYVCTYPGHFGSGMRGKITVQ